MSPIRPPWHSPWLHEACSAGLRYHSFQRLYDLIVAKDAAAVVAVETVVLSLLSLQAGATLLALALWLVERRQLKAGARDNLELLVRDGLGWLSGVCRPCCCGPFSSAGDCVCID